MTTGEKLQSLRKQNNYTQEDLADIMNVSSIAVLAKHIDRYIWPGPMPSAVENNMKIALEDIFYNAADIETALKNAEDTCNMELEGSEFESVEPSYAHASEAK